MRRFRLTITFVVLFATARAHSVDSCEAILVNGKSRSAFSASDTIKSTTFAFSSIEAAYWQRLSAGREYTSQNHRLFVKEGLAKKGDSGLCGPISVITALTAEIEKSGLVLTPKSIAEDLWKVRIAFKRKFNTDITQGLEARELLQFIKIFAKLRLKDYDLKGTFGDPRYVNHTISVQDLLRTNKNGFTVLSLTIVDPKTGDSAHHFVLRVGTDPSARRIVISDPEAPMDPIEGSLTDTTSGPDGMNVMLLTDRPLLLSSPQGRVYIDSVVHAELVRKD